jgi:SAM-dependent methyltransferase
MLKVARSLPSEQPISWQQGSALHIPFPDESFDMVLCQQGVQFFPDRAAGLREMRRVLVPGGRMAVAVWGPIERSPGFAVLASAVERYVGAAPAAAARSPFSLPDTGTLRELMDGAGLRQVEVQSRTKMLRFASPAEFVSQYAWASPIAAALRDADASVLEPVIADVVEALAFYLHDGALSFPIENHLAQAVRPSPAADR